MIAVTGAAQVAVQAIGFVSGILVIRLLPVHEYALYTLANTMLGTMVVLADGGIAAGVMAEGSKVWQDKTKLGAVLATGLALRRKFAVYSLLVSVPILLYLLRKHDASWLMSTLIVLSLIPAFFSSLSGKLLEIPPKLHQDIKPLQRFQVEANLGRLALMGLTMFVFPFAAVAIACAGISQTWNNWRIRQPSGRYSDPAVTADMVARRNILSMVRNLLPDAIYYCISGHLAIWIISILGSTAAVAQVGALSRFVAALALIQSLATTLLVPRFARLQGNFKANMNTFLRIQASLILVASIIVVICALIPDLLLKILGASYEGLATGLLLAVATGCVHFVSATTHQLLSSKGLVVPAKIFIPVAATCQCLLIFLLHPRGLNSVLLFSLLGATSIHLIRIGYLTWHLRTT